MKLNRLAKDRRSASSNCPAVYKFVGRRRAAVPLLVVQGKQLLAAPAWHPEPTRDESGVLIPVETVLRAMAVYLEDEPLPTPSWGLRRNGRALGQLQIAPTEPADGPPSFVVSGKKLSRATATQLQDVADDESAVLVSVEAVLLQIQPYLPPGHPASAWSDRLQVTCA